MAQKFLNGLHISGTVQLDFMPTHESEGIITLGRYDSVTSRYHNIKSYVSSTEASNYLKFSLHNGTANTVVDVLTLNGNKNATFAGDVILKNSKNIKFENSAGNSVGVMNFNASNELVIYNGNSPNGDVVFKDGGPTGTTNLTIDGATGKATFAGQVLAEDLTTTGVLINTSAGGEGLRVYTSDSSTAPNVKFGRNGAEYIGFEVTDRINNIIFRQDETTGNHEARFNIWSSADGNRAFVFKAADNVGANGVTWLTIENGDSTFAGDVTVGDDLNISGNELTFTNDAATAYIRGADALIIESDHDNDDSGSKPIYFYTNGVEMAKMEATATTFAGDVTATANYTSGNSKIIYKGQRSGGAVAGDWSYDDATTDMSLGTSTAHSFSLKTGNTRALTINSSQDATFASAVTSAKLNVNQAADGQGLVINGYDDHSSSGVTLQINSAGHARLSQTTDGSSGYLFLQAENYLQLIAGSFIYTTSTFRIYDNTQLQFGNSADYKLYHSTSADTLCIHTNDDKGITIDNAGNTTFTDDVTIQGDLSISGSYTQIDTDVNTTEQWIVTNDGTGPAAIINQKGVQDIFDVQDDGTSVFYIEDGGNVGIGTTDPSYKLHIADSEATINLAKTDGDQYLRLIGGSGTNSDIIAQRTLTLQALSGDVLLQPSNNVGIGTPSPGAKLHVFSAGFPQLNLESNAGSWQVGVSTGNDFTFRKGTSGSNYPLWLDSSGNVGIGTTSPGAKLHVIGTQYLQRDTASSESTTWKNGTSGGLIQLGFQQNDTDGMHHRAYIRVNKDSNGTYGGQIKFLVREHNTANPIEALTLRSSGRVGIGTDDPGFVLDVHSDSTSGVMSVKNAANARDTFRSENAAGTRTFNIGNDANGHANVLIRNSSGTTTSYLSGSGDSYFNGGNVGIGTTSPSEKIQVNGVLAITANDTAYAANYFAKIKSNYSANPFIIESKYGDLIKAEDYGKALSFHTGNTTTSERIRILSNGNVGIGITTPSDKLHTYGSGVVKNTIQSTDNQVQLNLVGSTLGQVLNSVGEFYLTNNDATADIIFRAGSSAERMRIKGTNGNVGIGDPTPTSKLDIHGNLRVGTGFNNYAAPTNGAIIEGNVGIGTTSPSARLQVAGTTTYNSDTAQTLRVCDAADLSKGIHIGYDTTLDKGIIQAGDFGVAYKDLLLNPNIGNVGIGTTSPGSKLDVAGSIVVSTNESWFTDNAVARFGKQADHGTVVKGATGTSNDFVLCTPAGQQKLTIPTGTNDVVLNPTTGNVGIGTTSPDKELEVSGDIKISGGDYNGLFFENASGTTKTLLYQHASYDALVIKDIVNNADRVTFKNNGNVGIGTTDPKSKLDVDGGVKIGDDTDTASADKVGTMRYRTDTEYVEVDGEEKVTNGSFDADSDWGKGTGWSISSSVASCDGTQSSPSNLSQGVGGVVGNTYIVTYTVSNYTSGSVTAKVGASTVTTQRSANGTYTETMTVGTNGVLYVIASSNFIGSIDNVSVKEVTEEDASYADMCMQTGSSTYEWVNIVRNTY